MSYELKPQTNKVKFSVAIKSDAYQKLINDTLGDKATAQKFVADITTVVSQNSMLQVCDAGSILSSGLTAQRLNLPLSPTLGFAYVVPYGNKAQFQIGWKGLVQLAIRTQQYETIGVRPVHEGENKGYDDFGNEQIQFSHEFDGSPIVGYFAYFKLINGFKKTLYWTKEQCEMHAVKYSKAHSGKNRGSEYDNWSKMFDQMAMKTVLKQLLSQYGIMSVEFQNAIKLDQATINEDDTYTYIDNPNTDTSEIEPVLEDESKEMF